MNTIDRILGSAPFLSYKEFTIAGMEAQCRGCTKGSVATALKKAVSAGILVSRTGESRTNYYRRRKTNSEWMAKKWVSEPTSDCDSFKWEYAK